MISRFALSIVLTGISTFACAAVSPEEAQKLGNTLTLFGAIKAGNAEGTIPPYQGGLRTAPADFEPGKAWTDPFREKNRCTGSPHKTWISTPTN